MVASMIDFALILVSLATLITAIRIFLGPTLMDRVVAFDGVVVNLMALIVLIGMRLKTTLFFDAAIALAILSFISSVAIGRYVERGSIIDGDSD